jgi:hypothetical protein
MLSIRSDVYTEVNINLLKPTGYVMRHQFNPYPANVENRVIS